GPSRPGPHPAHGGGRRGPRARPVGAQPCHPQAAGPLGHGHRRLRRHGVQRGVRRHRPHVGARVPARPRPLQRSRRGHRHRPPAGRQRRSHHDDAAQPARLHRRPLRLPDHVRGWRPGQRHRHRTPGLMAHDFDQADLTAAEAIDDPYPIWAEGRRSQPVAPIMVSAFGRDTWWVLRHGDVEHVLRDHETFSSAINAETMGPVMGTIILAKDGDEHRRYRDLVAKAFRASALERWGDELIRPTIHALLDRIAPRGKADLVTDFTYAYPVQIIAAILGVPVEDYEQFQHWADDINLGPTDLTRSLPAAAAMKDYLAPIVDDRRANPRGDLISDLVTAEVDGQTLGDGHIY